ncbi:hypothetical protein ETD86_21505 [Nonomuraea turkmeniaca]|uniref:Uncharacterized protein n=1 Tax=Nonomuraea turkmeniaca TaxID=103838 RepID=A0A5S4FG26_9ACTN|nr:hypothetical protein [Nonomuraea turkmeniaca]TMR18530.1 hypothetical protein ETD86_21505 [Nonomuraea turkmeniaca]
MSQMPTIGRIVHYTLGEQDATAINRRRADFEAFRRSLVGPQEPGMPGADGHQAHVGNTTRAGDVYPAVVVRVFPGGTESNGVCNLQVLLDGNDTYWATSRTEGDGEFRWSWPARS